MFIRNSIFVIRLIPLQTFHLHDLLFEVLLPGPNTAINQSVTQVLFTFVECVSGTFGDQCSKSCHCVNQPCNLQNGTCPDGGCESGYNGSTCSIGT